MCVVYSSGLLPHIEHPPADCFLGSVRRTVAIVMGVHPVRHSSIQTGWDPVDEEDTDQAGDTLLHGGHHHLPAHYSAYSSVEDFSALTLYLSTSPLDYMHRMVTIHESSDSRHQRLPAGGRGVRRGPRHSGRGLWERLRAMVREWHFRGGRQSVLATSTSPSLSVRGAGLFSTHALYSSFWFSLPVSDETTCIVLPHPESGIRAYHGSFYSGELPEILQIDGLPAEWISMMPTGIQQLWAALSIELSGQQPVWEHHSSDHTYNLPHHSFSLPAARPDSSDYIVVASLPVSQPTYTVSLTFASHQVLEFSGVTRHELLIMLVLLAQQTHSAGILGGRELLTFAYYLD